MFFTLYFYTSLIYFFIKTEMFLPPISRSVGRNRLVGSNSKEECVSTREITKLHLGYLRDLKKYIGMEFPIWIRKVYCQFCYYLRGFFPSIVYQNLKVICYEMLRNKLKRHSSNLDEASASAENLENEPVAKETKIGRDITSNLFSVPLWQKLHEIEVQMNNELRGLKFSKPVGAVYNPVEYASELHCAYMRKFLTGRKHVLFIGMNPGPWGMCQTGVNGFLMSSGLTIDVVLCLIGAIWLHPSHQGLDEAGGRSTEACR